MSAPSILANAPSLKDKKLLTFTLENSNGYSYYHAFVPAKFKAPQGTIGGEQSFDELPELWESYKLFIDLLEIEFDPEDDQDFLWCSEEKPVDIPVLDNRFLT